MNTKTSPKDLLRDLPNVFTRAADEGLNVPTYLERQDPSQQYDDKSDAFTRICREAALVTHSNPAAGLYATPVADLITGRHRDIDDEEIGKERGRALLMIWTERRWREIKFNRSSSTRALFTSEEDALGSAFRPYQDNMDLRVQATQPGIPVNELIATNTGIQGTAYRTVYMDSPDLTDFDYVRIPEGTEIPVAHLKLREMHTRIHKYGRGIDWTYEVARNTRMDKLRLFVQQLALAVEAGKVSTVVDTLINGDGNPGTAATAVAGATLDPAAAGTLTLRTYLRMKRLFKSPYQLTTLLAPDEEITNLELLPIGTTEIPLITVQGAGIGQLVPIGVDTTNNNIRYGVLETGLSADQYLLFDRNNAIERIYEIGATVSEADRFITSQVEVMTFTEVEGFAKMNGDTTFLVTL